MTIAVRLSESHYRQFLIFNVLKRQKLYTSPVIFASILTFSAIVCFLMHHIEGAVLLGSVLLVVGWGVPVVYLTTFFASLKKQVAMQKLNPPRLVYTLHFEEDSEVFEISNDKERARYRWRDVFHAYYETDSIYLFITKDKAFLLPLALLDSTDEVWNLIVANLGNGRCIRRA